MERQKTLNETCEEYLESQNSSIFIVHDLYKAVIAGCNDITAMQQDKAIAIES